MRLPIIVLTVIGLGFLMCQSDSPAGQKERLMEAEHQKALQDSLLRVQAEREREEAWVEEQWSKLKSEDQKLGQLFMIAAYPNQGEGDEARVLKAVESGQAGGIIVFKGTPARTASLINKYQAKAAVPLLVAVDGEWGVSMRMDSVERFPRQMLLGAVADNRLLYDMGKEVARQCRRLGINVNFAPVADVNNNANNPVIGDRSFGENRENVTAKAYQYAKGMQDHGVLAFAKHFPGHGDTDVDSHHDLPVIRHDRLRLDSIELYPFRNLVRQGVSGVMIAHLHIPSIDSTPNLPITLSRKGIQELLKDSLGFEGLVVTDAMNMQGVAKHWAAGKADAMSLVAGTDILLMSQDLEAARREIKASINRGEISWEEIERRVRKILHSKYRVGLNEYKPCELNGLTAELTTTETYLLKERLIGTALTLVQDAQNYLPITQTKQVKIATLAINSGRKNEFQYELDKFGIKDHRFAGSSITGSNYDRLLGELSKYQTVLLSIERLGKLASDDFGVSESVRRFVRELAAKTRVVTVVFGNPYSLKFFEDSPVLIAAYNDEAITQRLAAQAVMGGLGFAGRLPISASERLLFGAGKNTEKYRMPYCLRPEEVGLDGDKMTRKIDQIVQDAMRQKAFPGCQVLVAKDGKIAFHKAYGYHNANKTRRVELDNVYDLASVTKIAAATISLMKLYEEGKLDIKKTMGDYLPQLKGSNKADLVLAEVLAHQAGLKPWIPFYTKTLDPNKRPMPEFYQPQAKGEYCVRVADGMYFCQGAVDTIVWKRIYDSELSGERKYVYSDLGFYLFAPMVQNITGKPLDQYAAETFYRPMGLEYIGFNPLQWGIDRSRIVPTEQDNYFRYREVHGDVHDMGAALIGGVSGHAGLFATAADLAAVMQMLVNEGVYNNRRYLEAETVRKFIAQYASSRRALGFDRKEKSDKANESVNVAYQASDRTFGHLGFTGICAWADPDNNIVYLFLSNRTHPSSENNLLNKLAVRPRIHEAVYEARIR